MLENVVISEPEKLERLKCKIAKAGAERLHAVADFDRTLTTAFVDGKEVPSLISVLRNGKYLTPDYAGKAQALFNKYHTIEIDPSIPLEERKRAMLEWWTVHFDLLVKSGLNKADIEKVVRSGEARFRQGRWNFSTCCTSTTFL